MAFDRNSVMSTNIKELVPLIVFFQVLEAGFVSFSNSLLVKLKLLDLAFV